MNLNVLILLLLAHVIGDFYCQTDSTCKEKKDKSLKSWSLYFHCFIMAIVAWILIGKFDFWLYCLILFASHVIIDFVKTKLKDTIWTFFIDQILHIGIICGIAAWYNWDATSPIYKFSISGINVWLLILIVLVLLKPCNILIRLILEEYHVQTKESNQNNDTNDAQDKTANSKSSDKASALIGDVERLLTLCFVLINQIEAIGFVIAAKSLVRLKDEKESSEYVLAGTLLSFAIAVFTGLFLSYLK